MLQLRVIMTLPQSLCHLSGQTSGRFGGKKRNQMRGRGGYQSNPSKKRSASHGLIRCYDATGLEQLIPQSVSSAVLQPGEVVPWHQDGSWPGAGGPSPGVRQDRGLPDRGPLHTKPLQVSREKNRELLGVICCRQEGRGQDQSLEVEKRHVHLWPGNGRLRNGTQAETACGRQDSERGDGSWRGNMTMLPGPPGGPALESAGPSLLSPFEPPPPLWQDSGPQLRAAVDSADMGRARICKARGSVLFLPMAQPWPWKTESQGGCG